MTSIFLGYNMKLGAGLSFSISSSFLSNSGVLSLQGEVGALSLTAGSGIGISGLTITNTAPNVDYPAQANTWSDLQTFNGGIAQTNGGVHSWTLEGNNSNPSIMVKDSQSSTYRIDLGQASGDGDYFTNAVAGDSIIKGNYERLLLGVTGNNAGLIITNSYEVLTNNNTLDNGSGHMSVAGILGAQYINANDGNLNPNGSTPTMILSIWGGNTGAIANTSSFGLGISDSTLDFLSEAYFDWWAGTTEIMNLNGSGDLTLNGELSAGSYNLVGGTGISFSGVTITNTGVTSLAGSTTISVSGATGAVTLKGLYSAGGGIGISGATISNTGVTSLSGSTTISVSAATGGITLKGLYTAGSGISISGATISNTGILSLTAGSGIGVSGSTITNTGVLSLQGDTGALSLTAGSGIGISGLTITNTAPNVDYPAQANTWSGTQIFDSIGMSVNSSGNSIQFGGSVWNGSAPRSISNVFGIHVNGGSSSQLMTISSGPGCVSINNDGSIFVGAGGFTYNPFGTNVATGGDILANGNIAGGGSFGINGNATINGNMTVGGALYVNNPNYYQSMSIYKSQNFLPSTTFSLGTGTWYIYMQARLQMIPSASGAWFIIAYNLSGFNTLYMGGAQAEMYSEGGTSGEYPTTFFAPQTAIGVNTTTNTISVSVSDVSSQNSGFSSWDSSPSNGKLWLTVIAVRVH
ncbi:MAG: hypothetical protein QXL94_01750 [Candidatus Parvarchaeum sp.]